LDKAAARVGSQLQGQPEEQGDLWYVIGSTYSDMSEYLPAQTNFERAVDSYRLVYDKPNPKLALALGMLGRMQCSNGDVPTGSANTQAGLDMARKCGDPKTLAKCLELRAFSFDQWTIGQEAAPYLREELKLLRQFTNNPTALSRCLSLLADQTEDPVESESLMREALALDREQIDVNPLYLATDRLDLGEALLANNKPEEAVRILREAHDGYQQFSTNAPGLRMSARYLITALASSGRWDEAESEARSQIKEIPAHPEWGWEMLVRLKACESNLPAALDLSAQALQLFPTNSQLAFEKCLFFVQMNRLEDYRRLSHQLAQRQDYPCPKAALLLPTDVGDLNLACKSLDAAIANGGPQVWLQRQMLAARMLAEYRQGHFRSVAEGADEFVTNDFDDPIEAQVRYVEAAAYAQLHQTNAARTALSEGEEIIAKPHVDFTPGEGAGGGWGEWGVAEILRREAKSLIETEPTSK